MVDNEEVRALTSGITNEFVRFVFPSVFGLLAVSSASVIDGIFIGNFVGPIALASVNLTMPLLALVFGVLLMISMGGSVVAGKFLGENNKNDASNMFSKTGIVICLVLVILALFSLTLTEEIMTALGARGETMALGVEYIWVIAWFFPIFGIAILLDQFVRVDGRPGLSFLGMIGMMLTNIVLDYVLVAWLGWGLTGAALATGLSFVAGAAIVLTHFLGSRASLKYIRPYGAWLDVLRASYNGFSEFLNETSSGLVLLLFNWILMTQIGALGVAAFTIVDYVIYFGILISFGVSEGVVPLVSINFGGRKPKRIIRFVQLGVGLNFLIGTLIIASLVIWPDKLISLFLMEEEPEIQALAVSIIAAMWPMFLFNGANIAISAYFTGMQCARQSATIAFMRSLFLPVILILLLWHLFGFMGAFYALPISEAITFCIAVLLLWSRRPRQIIGQLS